MKAYRTWAEITPSHYLHNLGTLRSRLPAGVAFMAVVKANAYGHELGLAVSTLSGSVEMFGVANVDEAHKVRATDGKTPVFILGPALPNERREIVEASFIPTISSLEEAKAYAVCGADKPATVHLALDTGMGRIGIWEEEAVETVTEIARLPNLEIAGIASHLPAADEDETFTVKQLERFHRLSHRLAEALEIGGVTHVANSAGIITFASDAGDLVRGGLALYGSSPVPAFQERLRPVLSWKTRVTLVRHVGQGRGISYGRTFITPCAMKIATLAVGYADGFPRHLSNTGAEVLIGGRRCPVLGRVTMDQIMADVSGLDKVQPGDEAVILGQQGAEEILAAELAQKSGTIPWEIFTGIGQRVARIAV